MITSIAVEARERAWVATALIALVAVLCLLALFWPEATGAFRVWVGSTAYNHCFLVLPLVGYMIWDRRAVLNEIAPRPQARWLVVVPLLSVLWLISATLGIHEAQQLVVLTLLQAILLALLGWSAYKALLAPLLYLYFLVPSGEVLVPYLQDFTASMAVRGLRLVGIPVFSDGVFIEVPAGKFVVAEECAGLRFLIASIAFGVFFAVITYRSSTRRAIFIALSIAMPILANGARVFGIILAAEILGSPTAVMADHVIYGWGFFSAILLLLIVLGRSFADGDRGVPLAPISRGGRYAVTRSTLVLVLGLLLTGLGPAYAALLDREGMTDPLGSIEAPRLKAPWRQVTGGQSDDWTPLVFGADQTSRDAVTDGDVTIYRFVAYYAAHGHMNNLIRSENRIAGGANWRIASLPGVARLENGQVVNVSEIVSGNRRRLVLSYYVADGVATASPIAAKLYQLRGLIRRPLELSALVAVAIDAPDQTRSGMAAAAQLVSAMQTFPSDLLALTQH